MDVNCLEKKSNIVNHTNGVLGTCIPKEVNLTRREGVPNQVRMNRKVFFRKDSRVLLVQKEKLCLMV